MNSQYLNSTDDKKINYQSSCQMTKIIPNHPPTDRKSTVKGVMLGAISSAWIIQGTLTNMRKGRRGRIWIGMLIMGTSLIVLMRTIEIGIMSILQNMVPLLPIHHSHTPLKINTFKSHRSIKICQQTKEIIRTDNAKAYNLTTNKADIDIRVHSRLK